MLQIQVEEKGDVGHEAGLIQCTYPTYIFGGIKLQEQCAPTISSKYNRCVPDTIRYT